MTTSPTRTCPPDHRHDLTCYLHHGCRDTACRAFHAARMRERRRQIAYGTYTRALVDAAPVRDHVDWLRSQGMGVKTIAAASGVPFATISHIVWAIRDSKTGRKERSVRVGSSAARRLLAVRPNLALLADAAVIDATGYRRRLQALVAHGWTLPAIADVTGLASDHQLRPWLHTERITAAGARTIVEIFDRLQLAAPPQATPQQRAMSQRARRLAARYRWAPALAWDEIDTDPAVPTAQKDAGTPDPIDDIAVELALAGRGVRLTPGERRACVRVLHSKRWSDEAIAARLRCASKTVGRIREELGLPAWVYSDIEVMADAA